MIGQRAWVAGLTCRTVILGTELLAFGPLFVSFQATAIFLGGKIPPVAIIIFQAIKQYECCGASFIKHYRGCGKTKGPVMLSIICSISSCKVRRQHFDISMRTSHMPSSSHHALVHKICNLLVSATKVQTEQYFGPVDLGTGRSYRSVRHLVTYTNVPPYSVPQTAILKCCCTPTNLVLNSVNIVVKSR